MRSFASLYFFVRIAGFFGIALFPTMSLAWLFEVFLFGCCSLLIAIVRPYKNTCMNITDSLLLCSIAVFALLYIFNIYAFQDSPDVYLFSIVVVLTLPIIWFITYISVKILRKTCSLCKKKTSIASEVQQQNLSDTDTNDIELPDRVVNPELYINAESLQNYTSNSHTLPERALQIYISEQ